MTRTYHTTIEDSNGVEHDVIITYSWSPVIRATHDQPEEGGIEIEDVSCDTYKLSPAEECRLIDKALLYLLDNDHD